MADPFIGQVQIWANNYVPSGWAICRGGLLDINQNTALFSLIGNTYGGDGHISFGVPKLDGHAVMSWGTGPGLSSYVFGERGGYHHAALAVDELPTHTHGTIHAQKRANSNVGTPSNNVVQARLHAPGVTRSFDTVGTDDSEYMNEDMISTVGGSAPHENRQPFLALQFCIALMGTYPSRS
ncbi:phage tail protein [Alteromonas sp. S015]|uniref:phage tail protein n=1 Tax=Alteromonas sp. S015 TaxID=3117401 RepID=UPI002FE2E327